MAFSEEYRLVRDAEDEGTYRLTIQYRYLDGRQAAPTYTETHQAGETYSVQSPAITGFRPSRTRVTGVQPARDVVITVLYVEDTITIDDIDTPLGIGQVYINVGDCIE